MAQFSGVPWRIQRKRFGMGEEAQRRKRDFAAGGNKRSAACADEGRIEGELKQKLMELRN